MEEWESEYGPRRFRYKDLYIATKGFKDNKSLVGKGGFGKVYKGVLPKSKIEIAVKKVLHQSEQEMSEFVAEIVSLGRLRHRNLVQLLGYCRRKGELLLVYDYMPNKSLDKFLHPNSSSDQTSKPNPRTSFINWVQRFKIIKGVASGLLYLHEEWEMVVIHRDIKSSNVLLDDEFNGRLSDFGLARLHDHNSDPQTTRVAGTIGYMASEYVRTGRATKETDMFAFGAFLLETVCGKRPLNPMDGEDVLVHWVFHKWRNGALLSVVDQRLQGEFDKDEVKKVLQIGMMCMSVDPVTRPTIKEVVGYLDKVAWLPDLEEMDLKLSVGGVVFGGGTVQKEGMKDFVAASPSSNNRRR